MRIFDGVGLIISVLDAIVRGITIVILMLLILVVGWLIEGLMLVGRGLLWVLDKTMPECRHGECVEARERARIRRQHLARHWGSSDDED